MIPQPDLDIVEREEDDDDNDEEGDDNDNDDDNVNDDNNDNEDRDGGEVEVFLSGARKALYETLRRSDEDADEGWDEDDDLILTGETDPRHGQAWHHYRFYGRVRKWDGCVAILRVPAVSVASSSIVACLMVVLPFLRKIPPPPTQEKARSCSMVHSLGVERTLWGTGELLMRLMMLLLGKEPLRFAYEWI